MCVFNNKVSLSRPALIDSNTIELNYYSFVVSLDKRNESYNVVDDISMKICVPSEIIKK